MLNYASITNSGGRMLNEDCLKISCVSNRHCFVVCDGLGGHDSGNVASQIAANSFVDELYYCEDLSEYLLKAFDIAQKQVLLRQKENDANMLCTDHRIKCNSHCSAASHPQNI